MRPFVLVLSTILSLSGLAGGAAPRPHELLKTIAVPRPHHAKASLDGRTVEVGLFNHNRIAAIDTATDAVRIVDSSRNVNARAHAPRPLYPPASGASAGPFGTIWVANRDPAVNTIRAFDAGTGEIVRTVEMAPRSEPGDLAVANGKVYVSEERGDAPAIAVVDAATGIILRRFFTGANSRPHHVHASPSGNLVAVGLYGTDTVGVIDTRQDTPLGAWDSLSVDNRGRIHAAVFSADETALYLASDASNEVIAMNPRTGSVLWRLEVPGAHELAVSAKQKLLYVSRRTQNKLAAIRLDDNTATPPTRFQDVLSAPPGFPDGLPDTLQLTANEDLLTVGLRTSPARLVVVDTRTFALAFVNLGAPGETTTLAGHQWTSPDGHYTLASFEGGTSQGVAIIDHHSGHRVVRTLNYPGRPHGIVWAYP